MLLGNNSQQWGVRISVYKYIYLRKRCDLYLLGKSRELEHMKCLVEARRALINVDHHADPSRPTEEELEEVG